MIRWLQLALGMLKGISKFAFYFTTATYLLAVPVTYFTAVTVDALLPWETGLCIALSSTFYVLAGKQTWSLLK